MLRQTFIFMSLLTVSMSVSAEVTITPQTLQQGIFQDINDPKCKKIDPKKKLKEMDEFFCFTEATITHPRIEGASNNTFQEQANAILKAKAEKSSQKGKAVELAKQDFGINEINQSFTTDFNKNDLVAITFEKIEHWVGAAHGNIEIESFIFDLKQGRQITVKDLIGNNENKVNDYIRKELKKIDGTDPNPMQGKFIKKGVCDSCTISLIPQGAKIIFQTYAVGPGSLGPVSVIIPKEYIASAEVRQALE